MSTSRSEQLVSLENLRFRRQVTALHRRGPRLTAELLAEIARNRLLGGYIDTLLEHYLRIPDAALDFTGGRDLPPRPIRLVQRR